MSDMTGEACGCLLVEFKPKEHEDGSKTERWVCRDCGREFRPAIEPGELSPMAARIIAGQAAARGDIETLLRLMRANGVTRYRAGDLEIELQPTPPAVPVDIPVRELMRAWPRAPAIDDAAEQFGRAVRGPGYLERVPASIPEPDDAPPKTTPEPPDEQPVVEIDYAATEELLRLHDERRRGPSA